ncbi:MAG: ParB/RepB/Spo0J family partition protein [Bacilli bacterium]|nr:ParB/RepB/Spo0J family partition protein [Bacilli bacterium]
MKKDNKDGAILRSSLSTLLKRFSNTDVVGDIEKEYSKSIAGQIKLSLIQDNHVLKKARLNEQLLNNIMHSISEKGIPSPLLLMPIGEDNYEIIVSRATYIAAKKLNFDVVPAFILNIEEEEMLMLLASFLRDTKNSSIIEMSLVLNRLVKKYKYSQKEIAELMHISRSQVTNIIRLNKMPQWVLDDIANNKLSAGHARAISTLNEKDMSDVVSKIYENNLSVRQTEKIVYELKNNINYSEDERVINKLYRCKSNILRKRITLTFTSEKAKNNFLEKLKDENK